MRYKIVFFDIDGTLVNEEKKIPANTKEAVQKLKKRGTDIVIATGRSPFHAYHISRELEIDSLICFNGSYVEYRGQIIYKRYLNQDSIKFMEKLAGVKEHPIVYLSHEDCYSNQPLHPHVLESFQSLRVPPPKYHPIYWKESGVHQALLYCQKDEVEQYTGKIPHVELIRWHKYSMDVIPSAGSKAEGIKEILKHLGIHPMEAVAFGDGLNDKQMLSYVGMGIAMGNAHDELKPYAKKITKHVDDGGIYFGLEQIGLL